MREILFRGKIKDEAMLEVIENDNGWVYGSLVYNDDGDPIIVGKIMEQDEGYLMPEWWVEVIPETVGQYIGMDDKNGNKIFKGDIVTFYTWMHHELKETKIVRWSESGKWLPFNSEEFSISGSSDTIFQGSIEIIGNIYDNEDSSQGIK